MHFHRLVTDSAIKSYYMGFKKQVVGCAPEYYLYQFDLERKHEAIRHCFDAAMNDELSLTPRDAVEFRRMVLSQCGE